MAEPVSVSREVAAPPEEVWALVSDLTRMGEWSPEARGGRWAGGTDGPSVGAVFKGRNRNGRYRWRTNVPSSSAIRRGGSPSGWTSRSWAAATGSTTSSRPGTAAG